jgi:hypothetical protein
MKIAIVKIYRVDREYDYLKVIMNDLFWQEVSETEFEDIKEYIFRKNCKLKNNSFLYEIFVHDEDTIVGKCLEELQEIVIKEKEELKKEKERIQKLQESKKKKKEEKTKAQKLKQFEELKKELNID